MMPERRTVTVLTAALLLFVFAQSGWAVPDIGWPRTLKVDGYAVLAYQPQVDDWKDYSKIEARMAVEMTPEGSKEPIVGALWLKADTVADLDERLVSLRNLRISKASFPGLDEKTSKEMTRLLEGRFPKEIPNVSLDRILANLKRTKESDRKFAGAHEPPTIFSSEKPAILVQFDGKPAFYPVVENELSFAVNTNWDLFLSSRDKRYYLLNEETWLTTEDLLHGKWKVAKKLPESFSKIPNDENWQSVREHLSQAKTEGANASAVFVSSKPAELIVTEGPPKMSPVEGTELSLVSNADCPLFFFDGDKSYYYPISGRWFKAKSLKGPWKWVGKDLPSDFARIPSEGDLSDVLASVPGTAESEESLIQASIPRKARVKRNEAKPTVSYQGEPKFEPIKGTALQYGVNTQSDVIMVNGKYYVCQDGVWFVADRPTGPWQVATSVPSEIYSIPPSSPMYHTTYVQVYESTPDEVELGYTTGYLGCYEEDGALVYGTGYYYPPYFRPGRRPIFFPRPYSYGFRAYYNPFTGNFVRGGTLYGPYRGIGRGAVYNPATGAYARGTVAWGPHGAVAGGIAYSPATGFHAGVRHIGPYSQWGKSVAAVGAVGALGGIGAVIGKGRMQGIKESGKLPAVKDRPVARPVKGAGDLYVGKDGNVYKKTGKDNWSRYGENKAWQPMDRVREEAGGMRPDSDRGAGQQQKLNEMKAQQERLKNERARQENADRQQLRQGLDRADKMRREQLDRERPQKERVKQDVAPRRTQPQQRQEVHRPQNVNRGGSSNVVRSLNQEAAARNRGNMRAENFNASRRSGGSPSFGGGGGHRGGGRRR
jgi:hypothetical protein